MIPELFFGILIASIAWGAVTFLLGWAAGAEHERSKHTPAKDDEAITLWGRVDEANACDNCGSDLKDQKACGICGHWQGMR